MKRFWSDPSHWKNLSKAVVGGVVLLAAVAWLSGGCSERIAPDDLPIAAAGPPEGAVERVEALRVPRVELASGTVSSARHTTISSKILARIEAIPVRAGDEIERGTVVARLDARDLEARLRGARESVVKARAALALALQERQRIDDLHRSNVASRQQLDRVVASHQIAIAEVESAEQAVRDAEVALSHAEIRSPVSGRVVDRLAEPGDTAAPGAPLLRVYDPGTMRLEAPVRESLAMRLASGQPLAVQIEALDLEVTGEIDEIVPAAEPGARTFLVKIRLPAEHRLFAGMFGRVAIPAGESTRLVVSEGAIERVGQLEFVNVVEDDDRVARRLVTTGARTPSGGLEVLSGLRADERVLVP